MFCEFKSVIVFFIIPYFNKILTLSIQLRYLLLPGPVSRKPRKVFGPVKPFLDHVYLKTEEVYTDLYAWNFLYEGNLPCFIHIFERMKGGSLHTRSFRRIHFSVFRYRWSKNGFTGPESFRGFWETDPRAVTYMSYGELRLLSKSLCFVNCCCFWRGKENTAGK